MIRLLTAGESHGPLLTAILEGVPAGLPVSAQAINDELARRQQGYGSGGRMHIERDQVQIASGVVNGHTTGAPIALLVENRDYKNWKDRDIAPMTTPRPGHADLTGAIKYGYRELRLALERASAGGDNNARRSRRGVQAAAQRVWHCDWRLRGADWQCCSTAAGCAALPGAFCAR
jgi:chorismate synthase (EC 4.2.3.5)